MRNHIKTGILTIIVGLFLVLVIGHATQFISDVGTFEFQRGREAGPDYEQGNMRVWYHQEKDRSGDRGFTLGPGESATVEISSQIRPNKYEKEPTKLTFVGLLDAIEQVESNGDPNAINDNEVGSFQISKIYVDEVNRILKLEGRNPNYTYEDRFDKNYSRNMTAIYLGWHYNESHPENYTQWTHKAKIDLAACEYMARIHNGGPSGHKKESTKPYWEKVKEALEGETK